ncbi:hypothetical protein TNCT_81021 [Trichonephila clavata]|uniref:Uncharacterized protein n=1 Tax=Trichonephila clavata TaxID=2740835 RepID=A0A8X6FR41_TRICU|nr:hypothetical protein TNCT_81021 [Trichonephila clavata]
MELQTLLFHIISNTYRSSSRGLCYKGIVKSYISIHFKIRTPLSIFENAVIRDIPYHLKRIGSPLTRHQRKKGREKKSFLITSLHYKEESPKVRPISVHEWLMQTRSTYRARPSG